VSEDYSHNHFILRITREEWFKQVFAIKKYYPGVRRCWKAGGVILLVRKTESGDSFVGYGVLEKFVERNHLSEKERIECESMNWKGVLVFEELYKFEPPLPIKETFLNGSNAKGKCLQGYPLSQKQVESILDEAKKYSVFEKIN
jgi:hypothetical protein